MKRILAFILSLGLAAPALAASDTYQLKDNASNVKTFGAVQTGGGTDYPGGAIVDGNAGANLLGITANSAAKVEGVGTAGTPAGGVVSIQGVASGTVVPTSLASLPALATGSNTIGK